MEGGLDIEAHAAQDGEPPQATGAAETDEGNKFQKAIGAWRSMLACPANHGRVLTRPQTSTSPPSFRNSTR